MRASIIEVARDNIAGGRNLRGEEIPLNQQLADQAFRDMRGECEAFLDLHAQTTRPSRWWSFHPWILMAALLNRVKPIEILEKRKLSLTLTEVEPPVTITLSHAGRVAARSYFIEVAIQGIPEILRFYRGHGEVLDSSGSGHPLRRANSSDARNYREVVGLFAEHFRG